MRQLKFLVILVLLALLGGWTAVGQTIDCAEFKSFPAFFDTGEGNICGWHSIPIPIQFGKGWITSFSVKNSWASAHRVQFGWAMNPTQDQRDAGVWSLTGFYQDSTGSGLTQASSRWLNPNQVSVTTLQPAKGCNAQGQMCENAPDPNIFRSGVVIFGFYGASPEILRALESPALRMENLETGVILTVTFQKPKPLAPPPPATIATNQSSGSVNVSWSSSIAGPVVRIYRNGQFLWNQILKGSETDWSVPSGTHQYCIRSVNADWTESGDIACSSVVVQ